MELPLGPQARTIKRGQADRGGKSESPAHGRRVSEEPDTLANAATGPVAQGSEQAAHNRSVAGSNPARPTNVYRTHNSPVECDFRCV